MKRKQRDLDIFTLSFLDIVSCGFGAVILLVLISSNSEKPLAHVEREAATLLQEVLHAEAIVQELETELYYEQEEAASKKVILRSLAKMSGAAREQLRSAVSEAEKRRDDVKGLELVESSLKRLQQASISQQTTVNRDEEVGGIPVDSDYVVFIIDTSGSMKEIWDRVTKEIENVIRIHPKIKGFQILNDNGTHILSAYQGRWIPDTPGRRESVIKLFKNWNSTSNSSPVEGLKVALKRYANPNTKLSIYIFGDEYSGSSYDLVIDTLVNLNTNHVTGARLARIHAVGFLSNYSTGRFATLMREITQRNNGTFIALPR